MLCKKIQKIQIIKITKEKVEEKDIMIGKRIKIQMLFRYLKICKKK